MGVGPTAELTSYSLNIGSVVIGVTTGSCLEIINTGLIDVPFRIWFERLNPNSGFGFSPYEGTIPVEAYQTVIISFCSLIIGDFCEEVLIELFGNPVLLKVQLR